MLSRLPSQGSPNLPTGSINWGLLPCRGGHTSAGICTTVSLRWIAPCTSWTSRTMIRTMRWRLRRSLRWWLWEWRYLFCSFGGRAGRKCTLLGSGRPTCLGISARPLPGIWLILPRRWCCWGWVFSWHGNHFNIGIGSNRQSMRSALMITPNSMPLLLTLMLSFMRNLWSTLSLILLYWLFSSSLILFICAMCIATNSVIIWWTAHIRIL